MMRTTSLMALLRVIVGVLCSCFRNANAAELLVVNRLSRSVELTEPQEILIPASNTRSVHVGTETSFEGNWVELTTNNDDPYKEDLPKGTHRYAVLVIDEEEIVLHDTNDLQVELSEAAHKCVGRETEELGYSSFEECLAAFAFGGLPPKFTKESFQRLWETQTFWELCNHQPPAPTLRQIQSKGGYTIDILREEPLVATIREFVSAQGCSDLMANHAKVDDLSIATVGGEGKTQTSESRETLTQNMFIDWNTDNILTRTAATTFDLASELLGKRVPYEGQEPINFLHYLKGYEYKPHTDGRGVSLGDRVATTLIYCETAEEGGGTVFPFRGHSMRYQPNPGDLLFFEYQPNPNMALHAACPVISGKKSTFTQWHRLGVSPETPWWRFENWGQFENPFIETRWKGPRYGEEDWEEGEL